MKNSNVPSIQITNQVAEKLLNENSRVLFLPAGCQNLKDSSYEPYLYCDSPESAICLTGSRNSHVAVSNGCNWQILLKSFGVDLKFIDETRNHVPATVERILDHQFQNLAGEPNQRCSFEFVEWLYGNQPIRVLTVLQYLLSNPEAWLIGLPANTKSKRLFSGEPLETGGNELNLWYQLSQFVDEDCTR